MKKEKLIIETESADVSEPKLKLVPLPKSLVDGRDELNFAEFPLSALSERPDKSQKTIEFEDKIFDPSKRAHITRKVTITGSDKFGLPTPVDEEVLLALIQLSRLQGFKSKRVHFTPYRVFQLLKWPATGQSYARLEQSLNRWMGVTMYYKNAWRDRKDKLWLNESFHMLERVSINKNRAAKGSKQEELGFATSYFEWNEVVFRSFFNGNVKALNYDLFLSIESSIAKRLYRFLDKRFWHRDEFDIDLSTLAFEKVGLSRNSQTGDIKRKFNAAIDELEQKQFLLPIPKDERFIKQAPGIWRVVFKRNPTANSSIDNPAMKPTAVTLLDKLIEFGLREIAARNILEKHGSKIVEEKLKIASWMKANDDSRISSNPAGYLIKSIEGQYIAPKEYKTSTEKAAVSIQVEVLKKQRSEKDTELKQREEAREIARRGAIDQFLSSLSLEARVTLESEAIAEADSGNLKIVRLGGLAGETAKKNIVDRYVLEILANG